MPNYRRLYLPGQPVFITAVTYKRHRLFDHPRTIEILLNTINAVKTLHPFAVLAYVIMPDHFHLLFKTPEESPNYSPIIHSIKRNFIRNYRKTNIKDKSPIWQARFWDHVIRDDDDFKKHLDYIHWNPVKHVFVNDPIEWQWSTFSKWLDDRFYDKSWGIGEMPSNIRKMEFE
ncbi:MAG: transposase [Anaerolineaceae bacterium]